MVGKEIVRGNFGGSLGFAKIWGPANSRLPFCFTHSLRVAALSPGRRENSLPPFLLLRGDGRAWLHVGLLFTQS